MRCKPLLMTAVAATALISQSARAGSPAFDTNWEDPLGAASAVTFPDEAFAVTIDQNGYIFTFTQDHAVDKIGCRRYLSNRTFDSGNSSSNNTTNNPIGSGSTAKPFVAYATTNYVYTAGVAYSGSESNWYIMRFSKSCAPAPWTQDAGGTMGSGGNTASYSVTSNGAALYGVTNGYDEIDGLYVNADETRITVSGHHGFANSQLAAGAEGQAAVGRFDASTGLPIWVKTHHPSGSGGAGGHYDAADGALAMYTDNGTNYIYIAGRQAGNGISGIGAKAMVARFTDAGDTAPSAPTTATPYAHSNPFLSPVATAGAVVDSTGVYVGGYLSNFFGGVPSGTFVLKFNLGLSAQTATPYLPAETESRFTRTIAVDNSAGRGYVYVIGAVKTGTSGDTSLVRLNASNLVKDTVASPNWCHQSNVNCADGTEQTPGGIAQTGDTFYIVAFSTGFSGYSTKKNPIIFSATGF